MACRQVNMNAAAWAASFAAALDRVLPLRETESNCHCVGQIILPLR